MSHHKKAVSSFFKYALVALFSIAYGYGAMAQQSPAPTPQQNQQIETDFADEELEQFASAAGKVVVIQQETEEKMIQAIENEDLEISKFNEILMAQQNQQTDQLEATPEDLQKFDKAAAEVIKIQTEVQQEMVEAIQEEGLEPQKYEQILLAYQSDANIKAKIDALISQ